jgi:hypothetical protein
MSEIDFEIAYFVFGVVAGISASVSFWLLLRGDE